MNTERVQGSDLVSRARQLAEELLFPTALATDQLDAVPKRHFDRLAEAGLYGAALEEPQVLFEAIEALAGACLSTAFVWLQHLGTSRVLADNVSWGPRLATGEVRGGVAFAHLRRPGPPAITATQSRDGWTLNGTAPWVTGWRRIDVVHVAAMRADDPTHIVWLLIDPKESATLLTRRLSLSAVNASATVEVTFRNHSVGQDRYTIAQSLNEWKVRDAAGLRTNGSVAIGHAARSIQLLGTDAGSLPDQLAALRNALDSASTPTEVVMARAAATELAVRSATALVARDGGSAVLVDRQAQRLAREATFLAVQGQTPEIRAAQLALLTG